MTLIIYFLRHRKNKMLSNSKILYKILVIITLSRCSNKIWCKTQKIDITFLMRIKVLINQQIILIAINKTCSNKDSKCKDNSNNLDFRIRIKWWWIKIEEEATWTKVWITWIWTWIWTKAWIWEWIIKTWEWIICIAWIIIWTTVIWGWIICIIWVIIWGIIRTIIQIKWMQIKTSRNNK